MHGHIAEFMCDQVGSRYIQESILEHPTSEDCDLIFDEIHPLILQLSVDVFANFCVQKLLEKASTEQIAVLAINLKGSIMRLALQTYGCRVIQKVSPENIILFRVCQAAC
jgi:pumilio RNA-binding family